MIKIPVLDISGKKHGEVEVHEDFFGVKAHKQAIFDTVLSERAALRQGTHNTLTKAEVRGGGRKPWRQKGTGRARSGSIRNPHFVGGGVSHGPRSNRNYLLKVNRKIRQLAIRSAWSSKLAEQALIVTDKVAFDKPSTKAFKKMLENFKVSEKNKVLFIHDSYDDNVAKSASNLENVFLIKESEVRVEYILRFAKIVASKDYIARIGANK